MDIRLVAVDLDGTLLKSDKSISGQTVRAIRRASQAGVEIAFCTGRQMSECDYIRQALPEVRYAVSCTGALVEQLRPEKTLFRHTLTADEARWIYDRLRPFESVISFMAGGVVWNDRAAFERNKASFDEQMRQLFQNEHVIVDELDKVVRKWRADVDKFYVAYSDGAVRQAAWQALENSGFFLSAAGYVDMEIMSPEADKGKSLEELTRYLGLRREQVAAIGDSENDLAALRYAGLSVAMGSGAQILKDEADVVAPGNDENGVAWTLDQIVGGKL